MKNESRKNELARLIKEVMEQNNWLQTDVARELGVKPETVSRWMGKKILRPGMIYLKTLRGLLND